MYRRCGCIRYTYDSRIVQARDFKPELLGSLSLGGQLKCFQVRFRIVYTLLLCKRIEIRWPPARGNKMFAVIYAKLYNSFILQTFRIEHMLKVN